MVNLDNYILAANHSTEKYFIKNYIEVYNEILIYCNNINNVSFKQKLWHYYNQIPYLIQCANNTCNNNVNFKGRWKTGYYKYCSQKCSIKEVEEKKSLLNYSRKAKYTKEEKIQILNNKKNRLKNSKQKIQNKKHKKELYYNNLTIEQYKQLVNTVKSGIYAKESFVKLNLKHIYDLILQYTLNYDIDFVERVYMFTNNINIKPICKQCNNTVNFKSKTVGYQEFCSINCSSKYTNKQSKETYFKNSGYKHYSLNPYNIQKNKERLFNRIQNYINDSTLLSIDNDIVKIKCISCNKIHETHLNAMKQRIQLSIDYRDCITNTYYTSSKEKELLEFIKNNYNNKILQNDRHLGKELDIYLPELKLAFEFNGLYWHSELHKDKFYHYDKYKLCNNNNITLIQIYEDEWKFKQDIVKSRILNLLNKSNKIYARKCIIKQLPFNMVKQFLLDNHLQGSINSSINLGLYYNDELVSVMTFGKPRKAIKYKTTNNVYELYRFCNKLNTTVIGGASKLFKYFINNFIDVNEIYSFSNNEWPGNLYFNLNMKLKNENILSYWVINKEVRSSRHNFNKHNLIKLGYDKNKSANKILADLKLYKIYGAGTKTFIWNR